MVNRSGSHGVAAKALGGSLLVGMLLVSQVSSASASNSGGSDQTQDGVTFGIQPAHAQGRDARPEFSWGVTPGATLKDHVALVNYSKRRLPLSVYPTDAINTDEGGFGLLTSGQDPTDVGSWIDLPRRSRHVVVPPRSRNKPGELLFPLSVEVPADATPGDHSGGVVAVLTTQSQNQEGTNVKLEQRVGTRVFVRVAGEVHVSLAASKVHVDYHDSLNPIGRGSATVNFTVTNNGNVNVGATTAVDVNGLISDSSASAPTIPLLLVGNSVDMSVNVPAVLPQFLMSAKVTTTPVVNGTDAAEPREPATASVSFWAIPWVLLGTLLALALLVIGGLWWRQRRQASIADVGSPDLAEVSGGVSP